MLSEKLMNDRAGNFTASANHRLMAGWDKPKLPEPELIKELPIFLELTTKPLVKEAFEMFGVKLTGAQINEMWSYIQSKKIPQGLITYAQEKAIESLFDYDTSLNFSTVHTRNGEKRELECMDKLSKETGLKFVSTGDNQTHIHSNGIGCTPDGIVLDDIDMVLTGAEVKCKSPLEHSKSLLINNNEDMKKEAFEHYVQIQTQMLVTDTDHWYFANYNPFGKEARFKFKYIIIGRDDDFIKILKSRIEIAKEIKKEYLELMRKAHKE